METELHGVDWDPEAEEFLEAAQRLLKKRDAEIERLRATLSSAPQPEPSFHWQKPYVDWWFGARRQALADEQSAPRIVQDPSGLDG